MRGRGGGFGATHERLGWKRATKLDRALTLLAVLLCLLFASPASAQVAPQATPGGAGNENERKAQKLENEQPNPQTAPQPAPVIGPGAAKSGVPNAPGVSLMLSGITFDPSHFLSEAELNAIAKDYVGRAVTFADLAQLLDRVNALYRDKGQITARAILPPQKVKEGVVHIALVEGKLGKIVVSGAARTRESFVQDRIAIDPGAVIDIAQLSREVVFFNRTNDAQLRALLKPGAGFGETDIELTVQEARANTFQFFIDNQGVDSTGREEGGVYYRHADLFGIDDRFTFYGTVSRGGFDGTASYNVPFDAEGDRVEASYERNHIDILQGGFGALAIAGSGQNGTFGVTHPFLGSEEWLVTGSLDGAVGTSNTGVPSGVITDTTTYRAIGGLSATYVGSFVLASASPSFAFAHSHDGVLKKDRDFALLTGSGAAIVSLGDAWSVHLTAAGQFAREKLLPADLLFQIGGASSVRGFPVGTFAGDSGFYADAELHHQFHDIAKGLDVYLFSDNGAVYSTKPAMRSLDSLGFGTSLTPVPAVTFSASVGFPLKRAFKNQDGQEFYLQMMARL